MPSVQTRYKFEGENGMTIKERIEYAETKRDEAIKNDWDSGTINYWRGYIDGLNAVAKADVVEVVRCKDCKYMEEGFDEGDVYCKLNDTSFGKNAYCSYGKRRAE